MVSPRSELSINLPMHTIPIPVAAGVYRISLAWSNCYVLQHAGCIDVWLIDTGLSSDRDDLMRALSVLNIKPEQVSAVLLTHGHCDHAGSADYFHTEFGAKVYAHRDEVIHMNESKTPYGNSAWNSPFSLFQSLVFRIGERRFPVKRCSSLSLIADGDELSAPGGSLRCIHTAGHTPGHTAFYRHRDGVLFSGDAILNIVPNILPGRRRIGLCLPPKLFNSACGEVKSSAQRLALLGPAVLASGHGPPLTQNTADRLRAWLNEH